jgi:hypothetical protein
VTLNNIKSEVSERKEERRKKVGKGGKKTRN